MNTYFRPLKFIIYPLNSLFCFYVSTELLDDLFAWIMKHHFTLEIKDLLPLLFTLASVNYVPEIFPRFFKVSCSYFLLVSSTTVFPCTCVGHSFYCFSDLWKLILRTVLFKMCGDLQDHVINRIFQTEISIQGYSPNW